MKTSVDIANSSNPIRKMSLISFSSFLLACFLFAYLSDALIHCITTPEQDYYLYWIYSKSLYNWPIYLFISLFVASFGALYMYRAREERGTD